MTEELIKYETAKLAKEKGFDWDCIYNYVCYTNSEPQLEMRNLNIRSIYDGYKFFNNKIDNLPENSGIICINNCTAPTQSLLQRWLREVHKIHIITTSISQESWQYHITNVGDSLGKLYNEDYYNYEEALEAALVHALNLI